MYDAVSALQTVHFPHPSYIADSEPYPFSWGGSQSFRSLGGITEATLKYIRSCAGSTSRHTVANSKVIPALSELIFFSLIQRIYGGGGRIHKSKDDIYEIYKGY